MKLKSFNKTYKLPFKYQVPNTSKEFIKQKSFKFSRIKFLKRKLYLIVNRQIKLEVLKILPEHRHILWINLSAPSLGDSLMDLSSRVLLEDKTIDLFTNFKNKNLYENDEFFSCIYSDISQFKKHNYDLVIIDSFSTRSVKIKAKIAAKVPFVGIFGYYNGPEVNRVLYSFHQMNNLLGYRLNQEEIDECAKPYISISNNDKDVIKELELPNDFIAIVIGGEWSFRTFDKWDLLIEKLMNLNHKSKFILIGSSNGSKSSNQVIAKLNSNRIINYVSKFTFNQAVEVISNAKYVVCCDGGLMHGANSVGAPIVPLLAKLNSEMQLTKANKCFPLYDESSVNNIPLDKILLKCQEAWNSLTEETKGNF
jgi:ADP-heptose:LPS heptosyltransferase